MNNFKSDFSKFKNLFKLLKSIPEGISNKVLLKFNTEVAKKFFSDPLQTLLPYSASTKKGFKVFKARGHANAVFAAPTVNVRKVRWAEQGTDERKTKKGQYRGKIAGRHIIESYTETTTPEVEEYIEKEMPDNIERIIKDYAIRLKIRSTK